MSGHLVDLWGTSYAIASFVVFIINSIIYALAVLIPPLRSLGDWIGSSPVLTIVTILVEIAILVAWAALLHLLTMIWIERKLAARLQDRRGPMMPGPWLTGFRSTGFFQNIADALKLMQKENITPGLADKWMFHTAPAILISSTLMILVALPWSEGFVIANLPLGLLFIMASFSLAPLAILLAGWAQNNKFTLQGGLRSAALMMSYEIPMLLALIGVIILAGSLNPIEIVKEQARPSILEPLASWGIANWYIIPQFLGFLIFMIAMVAEMERVPFDLPEAEAELVEGWLTEYGGMRFGMVYGFKWLRTLAAAALVALLYLGGWSGPILPQELWFIVKTYFVFVVFIWITWSVPRVRIDQILSVGWRKLIPLCLVNIFIAALTVIADSAGIV